MRIAHGLLLAAALATVCARPAAQTTPRRHALLVGVTKYPNLPESFQLDGPINDVSLFRQTLVERFGLAADRIVELTERSGANAKPTRANIEAAFRALARDVRRGDQVFVLFAGHGSQQPDNDPPGADEADGLDEIFLPSDAAAWDGNNGTARNVVTDDNIRDWATAIRRAGAFVWFVFDSCQSATMMRGGAGRNRFVPGAVLGIPPASTRGIATDAAMLDMKSDPGGVVAFYAARSTEPTPELQMPDEHGPYHGLFSYRINEVLEQAPGVIAYRDLIERVVAAYTAEGRSAPTPAFEGAALDQAVFGGQEGLVAPRLLVGQREAANRVALRAGAVHGLAVGTILRVFPPAGRDDGERPIGHVRVVEVTPVRASIEPVAYGNAAAPPADALLPDSRCEVALYAYGADTPTIAVHPDPERRGRAGPIMDALVNDVESATNGRARKAAAARADWLLSARGEDIVLASAAGWRESEQPPFTIARMDAPALREQFADVLGRIARAHALLALARGTPADDGVVDVDVSLVRYGGKNDRVGAVVPYEAQGRALRPADEIAFRVANSGRREADVTMLFIDSHYGIEAIFPSADREAEGRLARGAEAMTSRFIVNTATVGWEHVVAIAVEAVGPRTDFRHLAQPSLAVATRGGARPRSPLDELLNTSVFGTVGTRSLPRSEARRTAIRVIAWRTEAR